MLTMSFSERRAQICEDDFMIPTNSENFKRMSTVLAAHPYIVLFGDYDVHIRVENSAPVKGRRLAGGTTTKRISRVFNLLDIACKMLATYCGMPTTAMATSFVSCHGDALRCEFALALLLRDICDSVVREWRLKKVSWRFSDTEIRKIEAHDVSLNDLLPYDCKMGEVLNNNILLLTEAEYKAKSAAQWDLNKSTSSDRGITGHGAIEVDVEDQVFNVGRKPISLY